MNAVTPNFCKVFPVEVIEQIFVHLKGELKKSMMVCRHFESVIGNSPVLMKRFKVCWSPETCKKKNKKVMLASKRKYSRVNFISNMCVIRGPDRIDHPAMEQFAANHAKTLKRIYFNIRSIKMFEMLSVVNDLEDLSVDWYGFRETNPLPRVTLKTLKRLSMVYCNKDIVSWMLSQPIQLEYLSLRVYDRDLKTYLIPFLQSQERLKDIFISCTNLPALFENRTTASSMKFKAESIHLENENSENEHSHYLSSFLIAQKISLKKLEFHKIPLFDKEIDVILGGLELSELKLSSCSFIAPGDAAAVNRSLKKLNISVIESSQENTRALNKFVQSCQVLERLKLRSFTLILDTSTAIAAMQGLEELTLEQCSLNVEGALNFPSVKILNVCDCKSAGAVQKLKENNPQAFNAVDRREMFAFK